MDDGTSAPSLLAFAVTSLIIELTPGPNMAYLAALSLTRGWKAGVAAVAGVALGLSIYGAAAAFGVAALIEQSRLLYEILRWAGVAYLLWLALEAWRSSSEVGSSAVPVDASLRQPFQRGLVTNLLNPKAAIFYVAVLPDFVEPTRPIAAQTLTLAAIYVSVATAIHLLIVVLASRLAPQLQDNRKLQFVRRVLALALAGIAVWFLFSTRR